MSTATKPREPMYVLATVTYDRARSTAYDELWHARSDRNADLVYEVRRHVEDKSWTCQCPGWFYSDPDPAKRHCKHVTRCKRRRALDWWLLMYLGWPRAELAAERDRLAARAAEGPLWRDDLDALDCLNWLLGERESEAA